MKPSNKVTAGALAAFVTTILVYILGEAGVSIPVEVGTAITGLLTFATSYLVPDADPT